MPKASEQSALSDFHSCHLTSDKNMAAPSNGRALAVGQRFDSFAQFQEFLDNFEAETYTKFNRADSRTVENANKRLGESKQSFDTGLKYAYVR